MLVFNGKESAKSALIELGSYKEDSRVDLLIDGLNLSVLRTLSADPINSEMGLVRFGRDPLSFISFKQKIRYALKNDIKIAFDSFNDTSLGVSEGIKMIDEITQNNGHIIIQLPITNPKINERIYNLSDHQDIDNLKSIKGRYGCTQAAIVGLIKAVISRFKISSIAIIGSSGFIGKGVFEKVTTSFLGIEVFGIDKDDKVSPKQQEAILSSVDLIISTASTILDLPDTIKSGLCIIDCGFIRGKLGIRGSIPIKRGYIEKYKFITPVPQGIGPLEMLYMVSRVKGLSDNDIDKILERNMMMSSL